MAVRPGGEYAGRPLNITWVLDCSGSMAEGGKIEALNNAIREVIPAMRKAAEGNPEVQYYIRAIRFSSGASWHIATPTLLSDFKWVDLKADGRDGYGAGVRTAGGGLQKYSRRYTGFATADRADLGWQADG